MRAAVEILGQVLIPGWWYRMPSFSLLILLCQSMYFIEFKYCKSLVNEIKLIYLALIMLLYQSNSRERSKVGQVCPLVDASGSASRTTV